jgi:2-methylcitrate dehydratase PrpD
MIFLVLLASVLMAAMAIYQYNEEADDYHEDRLKKREHCKSSNRISIKYKNKLPNNYPKYPINL